LSWQSAARQQTPGAHAWSLQLTEQTVPPQVIDSLHVPGEQLTRVSGAALSSGPWHEPLPLQATTQRALCSPQSTPPAQLSTPLQRTSHFAASQPIACEHEPLPSQRTTHELALWPQLTSPTQLFSVAQCTSHVVAAAQSTPPLHAAGPAHSTRQPTPSGHFTRSAHGCAASHVMTQTSPAQVPMPAHARSHAAEGIEPPPPVAFDPASAFAPPAAFPPAAEPPPPVLDSPPPYSTRSNKSFLGALPQAGASAAAKASSRPTGPQPSPFPRAIGRDSTIKRRYAE
jgi:hypothetical protein